MLKKLILISTFILVLYNLALAVEGYKLTDVFKQDNILIKFYRPENKNPNDIEYNYLEFYFKNKEIYSNYAFYELCIYRPEKNKPAKLLILKEDKCLMGIYCLPTDIIIFPDKNKLKFIKLVGYTGASLDDSRLYYVQLRSCNRYYIKNNELEHLDYVISCPYYFTYKIDWKNKRLILDEKKIREEIKNAYKKYKNKKQIVVFHSFDYLKKLPFLKSLKFNEALTGEESLGEIKILDLTVKNEDEKIQIKNGERVIPICSYEPDIIGLYVKAKLIDPKLAKEFLNKYFLFEDKDAYRKFQKRIKPWTPVKRIFESQDKL